jgi:hypothetical protein
MNTRKREPTVKVKQPALWFGTAVALAIAWAAPVYAQTVVQPRGGPPGAWRLIGTTQADRKADHDAIFVKGPFDDFRKVKFKVTNAGLNLDRMVITYDNGVPDNIEVRQNIPEGGESRQIDLRGAGKRSIRKIEFWYDSKGLLKRANVTVFGMK